MLNKESSHWMLQRLSGILLVPFSLIAIYKIISAFTGNESMLMIANSPLSLFSLILFAIVSFYHAQIGLEVIIDDYVQCNFKKYFLNALIKFANLSTIIFFVFALYTLFQRQDIGESIDKATPYINENNVKEDSFE